MIKKPLNENAWHPDFRDAALLPDIKVVRSIFFINFATLILAVGLLGYWGFLELQIGSLKNAISLHQADISAHKKANDELLRQSSEFEKWAKIINEIQGFVGVPIKPSAFLSAIGAARPPTMTLSSLSYNIEGRKEPDKKADDGKKIPGKSFVVYNILIGGSVTGTSQQATRNVEAFREKLEKLDLFKDQKFNIKPILKTFDRDKSLDIYTFTLNMEVRL